MIITHFDQMSIPATTNRSPECLWEKSRSKNQWVWNALEGTDRSEQLLNAFGQGQLYAILDGSYNNKFGTSVLVLCDRFGNKIWSMAVTPDPLESQSLH